MQWRMAPQTEVLDRISRLLHDDVRVRLDEVDGDFYIDPRSDLCRRILAHGSYEPEAVATIRKYLDPNRDFLDIGANIGFFTVGAATRLATGRVLAVEPTRAGHRRLARNVELNGVQDRCILEQCLVGDKEGDATLNVIAGREECSSIRTIKHPSAVGSDSLTETLPMHRIDDLVARHGLDPAVIKIDVEGAEGLVLAGAIETLKRCRPVIIAEFSPPLLLGFGSNPDLIVAQLRALGYRLTDPGLIDGQVGRRPYGELLAVPGS